MDKGAIMDDKMPNAKLRNARKNRNWTQQKLADLVDVTELTVGRWERGDAFPGPYHRQRLCEIFEMSLEELGLAAEEQLSSPTEEAETEAHEADGEPPHQTSADEIAPPRQRHENRGRRSIPIGIVLVLLVAGGAITYFIYFAHPLAIKPGGGWISPVGKLVRSKVDFAAYAYPTHAGDPAIDHVNFTLYWQGVDPRRWVIACVARKPVRQDIFACTADLRTLRAPIGEITISFDVYDKQGNHNNAPMGTHTVMYSP